MHEGPGRLVATFRAYLENVPFLKIVSWRRPAIAALAALCTLCVFAVRDASAGVLTGAWRDRAGACAMVLEQYDGSYYHLRVRPRQGE